MKPIQMLTPEQHKEAVSKLIATNAPDYLKILVLNSIRRDIMNLMKGESTGDKWEDEELCRRYMDVVSDIDMHLFKILSYC